MATYNDAIDDAIKVACPVDAPCDCIRKDQSRDTWTVNCNRRACNANDVSHGVAWCAAKNTADAIARLKRC